MTALDEQIGGSHYKKYPIQPWVFCETNKLTGAQTAVIDYVVRHQDKNGLQDLLKAKHHIDLMIEHYYQKDKDKENKYCRNCTDINEEVFVKKSECNCNHPKTTEDFCNFQYEKEEMQSIPNTRESEEIKETLCIDKLNIRYPCKACLCISNDEAKCYQCFCSCHKETKCA